MGKQNSQYLKEAKSFFFLAIFSYCQWAAKQKPAEKARRRRASLVYLRQGLSSSHGFSPAGYPLIFQYSLSSFLVFLIFLNHSLNFLSFSNFFFFCSLNIIDYCNRAYGHDCLRQKRCNDVKMCWGERRIYAMQSLWKKGSLTTIVEFCAEFS